MTAKVDEGEGVDRAWRPLPTGLSPPTELRIELRLNGNLAKLIRAESTRLRRRPVALVADILERVFLEGLVTAVLDE